MADPQNDRNRDGSQDRESQIAMWRLVISGIHIFCNVTLLSMAYALRDGGWRGLSFFGLFLAFTISSSVVISRIMELDPTIRSYPDIGKFAFGAVGYRIVWIIVFLFTYACCVENTVVARDVLVNLLHQDMFKVDNREVSGGPLLTMFMVLIMIFIVCSRDCGIFNVMLNVVGLVLTAVVVLSLVWQWIFDQDDIPHQKTLIFNPSMFPMAIGFYANCFSSHSSLPDFYRQTKNRKEFILLLIYM